MPPCQGGCQRTAGQEKCSITQRNRWGGGRKAARVHGGRGVRSCGQEGGEGSGHDPLGTGGSGSWAARRPRVRVFDGVPAVGPGCPAPHRRWVRASPQRAGGGAGSPAASRRRAQVATGASPAVWCRQRRAAGGAWSCPASRSRGRAVAGAPDDGSGPSSVHRRVGLGHRPPAADGLEPPAAESPRVGPATAQPAHPAESRAANAGCRPSASFTPGAARGRR